MNKKPLVSLFVLVYRQADYIKETLEGVVSQVYDNLEIIVSDDKSPDNTFDIIKQFAEAYSGPHKLIINRNDKNMGLVGHFNYVVKNLCHAEYLMPTGGDDVCLPNRVSASIEAIQRLNVDCLSLNMITINGNSEETGFIQPVSDKVVRYTIEDYIKGSYLSSGASRIFRRDIFDTFGYLNNDCQTEDSTLLFRAFLRNGVAFSYSQGLKYRIHGSNISIGVGQYNLKTDLIAKQYYKDLETAKVKGLIADDLYRRLSRKIKNYIDTRNFSEKIAKSNNIILKVAYKVALKYIQAKYIIIN